MKLHTLETPGYAFLEGEPGSLLHRNDTSGDTIIPGYEGLWTMLDECDSVEEAAEVARLWEERAPSPTGSCARLKHDRNTGLYEFAHGSGVEDWYEVRATMDMVEDRGPMQGWDPYNRLYRCTGTFGDYYYYAVAE